MTWPEQNEARARQGYVLINLARFGGLALVMLGIAIARGIVGALPWWVGGAIAMAGLLQFYFLPRLIARRWKSP